jgi:hypothetical protein
MTQLFDEIKRLKEIINHDSETIASLSSSDLLKRAEKSEEEGTRNEKKRKAGGQKGYPGKTCKGFSRVDRHVRISFRPVSRLSEYYIRAG